MKNINLEILAFQVTRKCNQECLHCCKGQMQNVDMGKEIVNKVLDNSECQTKEMTHLVITGGEPILVPNIFEYIINKIIEKISTLRNMLIYLPMEFYTMKKLSIPYTN